MMKGMEPSCDVLHGHSLWILRSCVWPTGKAKRGVKEAMRATADAITQCKFEATDPSADEVVLYNILQVSAREVMGLLF